MEWMPIVLTVIVNVLLTQRAAREKALNRGLDEKQRDSFCHTNQSDGVKSAAPS